MELKKFDVEFTKNVTGANSFGETETLALSQIKTVLAPNKEQAIECVKEAFRGQEFTKIVACETNRKDDE